jgi:hypothetical protein
MSDFLAELRREVLDAHAAHARRRRSAAVCRRFLARFSLVPLLALPAIACLLAVLMVLGRDDPPSEPRVVARLDIGGTPAAAVYADGSLWVTDYTARQLVQISTASREVVRRIPLDGTPEAIAADAQGELWARVGTGAGDRTVLMRIDTRTGRAVTRRRVGPDLPLAVSRDAVWAAVWATDDNRPREGLYRLDTATGVLRRLSVPGVGQLAVGDSTVWALRTNGNLIGLDEATGARRWHVRSAVPAAGATAGRHALVASNDDAWVLSTTPAGRNTLAHIQGENVTRRGADPRLEPLLATDGEALWSVLTRNRDAGFSLVALDKTADAVPVDLGGARPIALAPTPQGLWVVSAGGTASLVSLPDG